MYYALSHLIITNILLSLHIHDLQHYHIKFYYIGYTIAMYFGKIDHLANSQINVTMIVFIILSASAGKLILEIFAFTSGDI